ncbi:MAG: CHAT domain-containing protein [Acidobacteriota bacterium]|nr:CHAT domain-containing protein [Acidobacteriota bacterium]
MSIQPESDFCWIRIRILGPQDGDFYRVEAELDDGSWHKQRIKIGDAEEQELIRRRDEGSRSYGQYLYQLLFLNADAAAQGSIAEQTLQNALQKAWGRAQSRKDKKLRVQLWISEECAELHRFRWERLFVLLDEKWRSLANYEQTPFSRFTRLQFGETQLNPDARPLTVLLAISSPSDLLPPREANAPIETDDSDEPGLTAIKVEEEVRAFYEAVKDIPDIEVSVMPGQTGISDELKKLLKASPKFHLLPGNTSIKNIQNQFNHHVLHFLGHGVFERVQVSPPVVDSALPEGEATDEAPKPAPSRAKFRRATLLLLEKEDGTTDKIPDDLIVAYLAHRGTLPRLVFLSACDTTKFDERNPSPFAGLGPKLVAAGFPAVVAMQDQVPMEMARELVEKFYSNLLREGVIDLALNRSRLFSFDQDNLLDSWTIPVLFMRTPNGRLFTANREREALRAITESLDFRPSWNYGNLPLEAVMLVGEQITSSWENLVLPMHGRIDLHSQLQTLLERNGGKEPLLIAVTGQRGTARSTALKWLVRETAAKSLLTNSQNQVLPIYVDLQPRVLASGAVPSYLKLLTDSLNEFWPGDLTENEMDKMLRDSQRKFRFFFDHGDDLSESQRRSLLRELSFLKTEFPQHPCVITMTRGFWGWEKTDATHVMDVQPLSRRRIIRFLADSTAKEEKLRLETNPESEPSSAERALLKLRRELEETQLFDLAGMPWMFVQLIRQSLKDEFPRNRVSVLQDIIEDKVRNLPTKRGLQARALDTLYLLAYRMQMTSEPNLPIKDALELIAKVRDNREYQLEEMLEHLIDKDLLANAGGDSVRFLYSAYQAYCCAQYLKIQNNSKRWEEITAGLGRISHLRRWDDTLTLLAGMVNEPKDLLEKIAYSTSLKDGEQVFLAARCLLEAQLNGKTESALPKSKLGTHGESSYVESMIVDALIWRSNSENEPRSFQRLRAVESLGRLRRLEIVRFLTRIAMEKTRVNSNNRPDFEYGGIRQAAGRALRRLLPPRNQPDNEFTLELRRICPELEALVQEWIRGGQAEIRSLETRMKQSNSPASGSGDETVNDGLASMAAFALGDLRDGDAHGKLLEAFLDETTDETIRWAITDALSSLDPERVMRSAILPLIEKGSLNDQVKFSERREQLIYLVGQIRHPNEKAREFVESMLKSPDAPYQQKGRAILAIGYLHPPNCEFWKSEFEAVALCEENIITKKESSKSKSGLYLRTKALQALAEIGDLKTIERLRKKRHQWPPELEKVFYSTNEEIIWRNNG